MTGATTLDRESFYQTLTNWKGDGPVSVAVADIDEFMPVNQNYGREVGDAVIALVMKALAGSLPPAACSPALAGTSSPAPCRGPAPRRR